MMIVKAKVMRDDELTAIPAAELAPGDIVSVEAGDIIPADGRLIPAASRTFGHAGPPPSASLLVR